MIVFYSAYNEISELLIGSFTVVYNSVIFLLPYCISDFLYCSYLYKLFDFFYIALLLRELISFPVY